MSPFNRLPDQLRMRKPRAKGGLVVNAGLILALSLLAVPGRTANAAGKPEYNRDIRPILAENCFACHGPDSTARKADLRLDRREAAIDSGAITPGDLDSSELITRINTSNAKEVMPPPSLHKTLTQAQKDALRQWVEAGAEYQLHWSLIPPTRPALPKVKNASWVRNPIDRFILAKLEEQGLQPAAEADRRTLVPAEPGSHRPAPLPRRCGSIRDRQVC